MPVYIKKAEKLKAAIPYILAIFVSIYVSFPAVSYNLRLDEAYSIDLVRGSISGIIRATSADVHPPLYYLILKVFNLWGNESLLKYKMATALGTYLNLILLGATVVRKRWGCRVSVLYILWFGLTYSTLDLTTFVRMYTWAAFFVTAATLFLFLYYENNRKRDLFFGIIMTLGAMYTHYYALIASFFIWLFLLMAVFVKKRKRTGYIFLGGAVVTIGYLPWLRTLLAQSSRVANDYWMKGFDWNEWRMIPATLMESEDPVVGIGAVLYAFLIILLVLAFVRKKWDAILCATVFFCTTTSGALISEFVTPIWATRYIYVVWGLAALFVSIAAGEVLSDFSNIIQGMLVVVIAISGLVSLNMISKSERMVNSADEWVAFLEENVDDDAYMIVDDPAEHNFVYKFYLHDAEYIFTENLLTQDISRSLDAFLKEGAGHQIWCVIDYRQQKIGFNAMQSYLEELGYTIESVGYYTIEQKDLEVFKVEKKDHE